MRVGEEMSYAEARDASTYATSRSPPATPTPHTIRYDLGRQNLDRRPYHIPRHLAGHPPAPSMAVAATGAGWASPRSVETSPMREGRWQRHVVSSTGTSVRARFVWSWRPVSRSRRWPGTWGSMRARWAT